MADDVDDWHGPTTCEVAQFGFHADFFEDEAGGFGGAVECVVEGFEGWNLVADSVE